MYYAVGTIHAFGGSLVICKPGKKNVLIFGLKQSHFKDFILTDNCSTDFLKKKSIHRIFITLL